jgi:hypothetical protein
MLQMLEKIEQTPVRKVEEDRLPRRQNAPLPALPDR